MKVLILLPVLTICCITVTSAERTEKSDIGKVKRPDLQADLQRLSLLIFSKDIPNHIEERPNVIDLDKDWIPVSTLHTTPKSTGRIQKRWVPYDLDLYKEDEEHEEHENHEDPEASKERIASEEYKDHVHFAEGSNHDSAECGGDTSAEGSDERKSDIKGTSTDGSQVFSSDSDDSGSNETPVNEDTGKIEGITESPITSDDEENSYGRIYRRNVKTDGNENAKSSNKTPVVKSDSTKTPGIEKTPLNESENDAKNNKRPSSWDLEHHSTLNRNKRQAFSRVPKGFNNYVLSSNLVRQIRDNMFSSRRKRAVNLDRKAYDEFYVSSWLSDLAEHSHPYVAKSMGKYKRDHSHAEDLSRSELVNYDFFNKLFKSKEHKHKPVSSVTESNPKATEQIEIKSPEVSPKASEVSSQTKEHDIHESKASNVNEHVKENTPESLDSKPTTQDTVNELKASKESETEVVTESISEKHKVPEKSGSIANVESEKIVESDKKRSKPQETQSQPFVRPKPVSVAELFSRAQKKSEDEGF